MNSESITTRQRSHLFLLVLILALAAALRCFSLSALGFWTDEFCTLSCSHGYGLQFDQVDKDRILAPMPNMTRLSAAKSFTQIIPAMVQDEAHPPLYFLLLRLWEDIFGDSESAVRSLDVVFSLIAIALLFFTATDSIGTSAALCACLLMAVATPQIQFAQEARNYMPVVTFSLAAMLALQQLERRPAIAPAVALAASLLAMMLTHYFAAGTAIALAIYVIFYLHGPARMHALIAFTIATILFLGAWGPSLLKQSPHFRSNYAWVTDDGSGHVQRVLINLCKLPLRLIGQWPDSRLLQMIAMVAGALLIAGLPVLFIRRPQLRIWLLWLMCSIGTIVAVDLIRSTAQLALLRYSLFATPPVYVLIAAVISKGRWRMLPPLATIILAILSLPDAYIPAWKIDFRTPVLSIARRLGPQDGLIISGPQPIEDGVMFAAFHHYLPHLPATTAVLTAPPDANTLARFQQCPRVWVVWLWTDRTMPNFDVQEEGRVPYFADLMLGRFRTSAK